MDSLITFSMRYILIAALTVMTQFTRYFMLGSRIAFLFERFDQICHKNDTF